MAAAAGRFRVSNLHQEFLHFSQLGIHEVVKINQVFNLSLDTLFLINDIFCNF